MWLGDDEHTNTMLSPYRSDIDVAVTTAWPNGDVVHEVKYGQRLWSIAIEQIKRLNNLADDTVVSGWKLLVQKGATQCAPATATFILSPQSQAATSTPIWTTTPTLMLERIKCLFLFSHW